MTDLFTLESLGSQIEMITDAGPIFLNNNGSHV